MLKLVIGWLLEIPIFIMTSTLKVVKVCKVEVKKNGMSLGSFKSLTHDSNELAVGLCLHVVTSVWYPGVYKRHLHDCPSRPKDAGTAARIGFYSGAP